MRGHPGAQMLYPRVYRSDLPPRRQVLYRRLKSNRIEDGYDRPALEACMDSAGYHLQYRLYTIAVQRWLRQVLGAGFDPQVHFGGVFYFFIRA